MDKLLWVVLLVAAFVGGAWAGTKYPKVNVLGTLGL